MEPLAMFLNAGMPRVLESNVVLAFLVGAVLVFRRCCKDIAPRKLWLYLWWILLIQMLLPIRLSLGLPAVSQEERSLPQLGTKAEDDDNADIRAGGASHDSETVDIRAGVTPHNSERVDIRLGDGLQSGEVVDIGLALSDTEYQYTVPKGTSADATHNDAEKDFRSGKAVTFLQKLSTAMRQVEENHVFLWIWLVPAMALLLSFLLLYLTFLRRFSFSFPVEGQEVKAWQQSHPMRRRMQIRCSDEVGSPLSYGVIHPVILLPSWQEYTAEERDLILEHECVHVRRLDALAKELMCVAVCFSWFNPFAWLMLYYFNRDMELSCDEQVVENIGWLERKKYAAMLIRQMEKAKVLQPAASTLLGDPMEERLTVLISMKRRKGRRAALAFAIFFLMFTGVLFSLFSPGRTRAGTEERDVSIEEVELRAEENSMPLEELRVEENGLSSEELGTEQNQPPSENLPAEENRLLQATMPAEQFLPAGEDITGVFPNGEAVRQKQSREEAALLLAMELKEQEFVTYGEMLDQLQQAGFTYAEAVYAADGCGVDWAEQAADLLERYYSQNQETYVSSYDRLRILVRTYRFTEAQAWEAERRYYTRKRKE